MNDFDTTSIHDEEPAGGLKGLYWLIPFLTVNRRHMPHIEQESVAKTLREVYFGKNR